MFVAFRLTSCRRYLQIWAPNAQTPRDAPGLKLSEALDMMSHDGLRRFETRLWDFAMGKNLTSKKRSENLALFPEGWSLNQVTTTTLCRPQAKITYTTKMVDIVHPTTLKSL